MTATAPVRSLALDCQISLIPSPLNEPVLRLLGCSRWQVVQPPDLEAAIGQIQRGLVPVIFCGPDNWRQIVDAASRSPRPPGVITLTAAPNDIEWLEVLQAGAHYLPLPKLRAAHLFSLLNLLWRGWRRN